MSTLSAGDKSLLEMLFDMKTGYVGDFSNTSFQRFVIETVDIDPYEIAQTQLSYPSQSPLEIAQAARLLFNQKYRWLRPVRAITVTGINLISSNQNMQIDMFGDAQKRMRRKKLDDCIDEIRGRFGKNAICSASLMGDLHMPGDDRHLVHMPGMMYS